MRFPTAAQYETSRLAAARKWHKKFAWVPVEAETAEGPTTVWFEWTYRRLKWDAGSVPRKVQSGYWQNRVVEYHVQQLLTEKGTQS